MIGKITRILVFLVSFEDILAITIEQTNGYNDTWTNINRSCSLVGTGLRGSMQQNQVQVTNANDLTGTGWISAHVKIEGTLQFAGCIYAYANRGARGIELSGNWIAECLYYCDSRDIVIHCDLCYCAGSVTLYKHFPCSGLQCGNDGPLFCGIPKTTLLSLECMCWYQSQLTNTRTKLLYESCQNQNVSRCTLSQSLNWRPNLQWNVICRGTFGICEWNGIVPREVFYWGFSPSTSGNNQYCVAVRRFDAIGKLVPVVRSCTTKLIGLCNKGTRISATSPFSIARSTTAGYDLTSTLTSQRIPKYTTNNAEVTSHDMLKHTTNNAELTSHDIPEHTTNKAEMISPTTNSRITYSHLTGTDFTSTSRKINMEITDYVDLSTSDKPVHASRDTTTNDQTDILGPVLGGVGTFVVILIASVAIMVVLVRKRRRKETCRSELPRELHSISSGKPHENQNLYSEVDSHVNGKVNRTEDNGDSDSFSSSIKHKSGPDMYDDTSTTHDNMYGRLNRNGKPNAPSDTADVYDHTRSGVNGDTYDTLQTGECREDSSNGYYDHTFGGETYGHLGEEAGCMEGADDTYDNSGVIIRNNGDMYDSFQTDRDGQETDVDRDEYSSINTGYGYLH